MSILFYEQRKRTRAVPFPSTPRREYLITSFGSRARARARPERAARRSFSLEPAEHGEQRVRTHAHTVFTSRFVIAPRGRAGNYMDPRFLSFRPARPQRERDSPRARRRGRKREDERRRAALIISNVDLYSGRGARCSESPPPPRCAYYTHVWDLPGYSSCGRFRDCSTNSARRPSVSCFPYFAGSRPNAIRLMWTV